MRHYAYADRTLFCAADDPPPFDMFDAIAFESGIDCEECCARAALAIAKPGDQCPYCGGVEVDWTDGVRRIRHDERCKVIATRPCSICGYDGYPLAELVPVYEGARLLFECRDCRTVHPRSGRYAFVENSGVSKRDMSRSARLAR